MATIKDGLAQRLPITKLLRLAAQLLMATGNTADIVRAGLAIEALDRGDVNKAFRLLKERSDDLLTESIQETPMAEQPTGTIALMNDLMVAWKIPGNQRACVNAWWSSMGTGTPIIEATAQLSTCLGGTPGPDPPDPPDPSDWWIPNDQPRC